MIPAADEAAVVAPVNVQVNFVTAQLSAVVGFVVATLAVHDPTPTLGVRLAEHEIVGAILSVTVTV